MPVKKKTRVDDQPPLMGEMSTEEYRQVLAGLVDRQQQTTEHDKEQLRRIAVDFVAALPEVFGEELDRITLWDRIGSGIETARAKVIDDVELFISLVLEHVKASESKVAVNVALQDVLLQLLSLPLEAQADWIRYLGSRRLVVITKARARWQEKKSMRSKGAKT